MQQKLTFLFLLAALNLCFAQQKSIDYYFDKAYEHYYSNKDSAYHYFNKVKTIAKKENNVPYLIDVLISENWSANYHYDLGIINNNLHQLDSTILANKKTIDSLPEKNYYYTTLNYSKGLYDYELKNYDSALKQFINLVLKIEEDTNNFLNPTVLSLYVGANNFIGKIYNDENKFKLAKSYYNKNLRVLSTIQNSNVELSNTTNILLGQLYEREGKHAKANNTILRVLDHYINVNKNSNRVISSYQNIIKNHLAIQQLDSAKFYLVKMKESLPENHPFWYRYHLSNSNVLKAEHKFNKAINQLNNALVLVQDKWDNQPHNDIVEIYNTFGSLYFEASNPEKAIEYYNLAINLYESNPIKSTINKITLLKTLKLKAHALDQINNYQETITTVDQAVNILDDLKPTFKNNTDKLFLIENAFPLFELGIKATFNLYNNSQNEIYLDKAFLYSEKSKAVLLLESLLSTKAFQFSNIPEAVIEEELLQKSKITHIEKLLNNNKTEALEDELFQLKTKHIKFIETLETKYKNYYNLKYNTKVATLQQTKQLFNKNTTLLSYFYGEHNIYTIAVTGNKTQLTQTPITPGLKTTINKLQHQLSNPNSNLENTKSLSQIVYNNIISNINIPDSTKNLVIIADGVLNYIPFSALVNNNSNFLIQKYACSYVNSVTLLQQLQTKKVNNGKLLAIAPTFTNTNKLLPLPNNTKEANNCLSYFNGKVLQKEEATLQNFNSQSTNYSILHLATHAIFNDETPEFSFLAFTPKAKNNSVLYTKDLYNLKLNSDLVTLSACESGIGDLKRGEGLLSLARGFYFSGANSISSTLWKINDASSTKIMNHFYANLAKGEPKQVALQNAQLKFITNNKDTKLTHPYYWSGVIISGNTKPITTNSYWFWYIIGGLVLIIIVFIIKSELTKRIK